ncbi:hypothetical protein PsorP6_010702 [Peronosclerospora sorghi]|uniref:Uncharacterized protein n=1 Tax=Peronosclerospora sorghi TaxID=230839 RepID=A0ACC0VUK0_9STRA|nr:hypothetical protein PsorP6_010702 [Peronosclerospora sorghi]
MRVAAQNIPYDTLMHDLGVSTVPEVKDILIDTIYSVRLTHISEIALFRCEYAVGRDTRHEDVDNMIQKLTNWKMQSVEICEKINTILTCMRPTDWRRKRKKTSEHGKKTFIIRWQLVQLSVVNPSLLSEGVSVRAMISVNTQISVTRRGFV